MRGRFSGFMVGMLAACGTGLGRIFGGEKPSITLVADAPHLQLREPSVRQAIECMQLPTCELRSRGVPPKVWCESQACARMVRKNRLRCAGVAGQRC